MKWFSCDPATANPGRRQSASRRSDVSIERGLEKIGAKHVVVAEWLLRLAWAPPGHVLPETFDRPSPHDWAGHLLVERLDALAAGSDLAFDWRRIAIE